MFKLQRIDVSGFKSFVDPVSTEFSDGITAIVGPNGCGKSNLSEAITWVLGEQSAKSLRGGKMEDVIFSGTDRRKPLGMAEVSLTLEVRPDARDSEDLTSIDAIEDGRMIIGRRVFRSGESQYRLNDKVVRLKEIKDILADTGLGVRAYSVIEQGKIGQILSGKPQERRKLIEEAAGITRYKARKRLAELKLEEATANRMRRDDILSEVESALREVKRQSNAARRYKEREGEIRELALVVLRGRWAQLCSQLGSMESEIGAARAEEEGLGEQLVQREAELKAARTRLEELGARLSGDHERVAEIGARIEGRQEFVRGSRQTLDEIAERLRRGDEVARHRREEDETRSQALKQLVEEAASVEEQRDLAAAAVASAAERLATSEQALTGTEAEQEAARAALMQGVAQVSSAQGRLHRAQIEEEKGVYRLERTEADLGGKREESTAAGAELAQTESRLADLEERLQAKATEHREATGQLDETLKQEKRTAARLEQLRGERGELQQRQRLLRELGEAEEKRREQVRQTFVQAGIGEPRFLDQMIEVPQGWEGSLDLYLESLQDVVVLPAGEEPLDVARRIADSGRQATLLAPVAQPADDLRARLGAARTVSGRRSLLAALLGVFRRPAGNGGNGNDGGNGAASEPLEGLVGELGEALGLAPELANALPAAFLVETAADAIRFAQRLRGVAFISRERMWAQDGALHVQSDQARPGVLGRARELEKIAVRLPELQESLEHTERELRQLVTRRSELAERSEALQTARNQLQQERAVAVARRQDARDRCTALGKEVASLESRLVEGRQELEQLRADKAQLQQRLAEAQEAQKELDAAFEQVQERVAAARAARETGRNAGSEREAQLRLLEGRVAQQARERKRLEQQRSEIERYLEQWQEEQSRLGERSEALEREVEGAERELAEAGDQRSLAEQQRALSQQQLAAQRESVQQLEVMVQTVRDRRDESRGQLGELRVRQASRLQDAEHLREEYREEFRDELPDLAELQAALEEAATAPVNGEPTDEHPIDGGAAESAASLASPALRVVPRSGEDGEAGEDGAESEEVVPAAAAAERREPTLAELFRVPDDLDELRRDLADKRDQLQRMGPVNVLAAEEYAEQEERFGTLSEQRADVQRSILSLRKTIEEINATSQERFLATFVEVNEAFGVVFANLFQGGEASMRLLDEDDPIETGIEIVARPPGKRLQNIQLLSGGEKALTAIALLFALFQTKPSPFCILDEVDAPLDDANVLRFVRTLREMARDTQFLVVTHNKLTMEAASCLYGVTMAEKGVSKLVGVDIDDLHPQSLTA